MLHMMPRMQRIKQMLALQLINMSMKLLKQKEYWKKSITFHAINLIDRKWLIVITRGISFNYIILEFYERMV